MNWYSLHTYVDSFQGCYKDGTEPGTYDCRWFSVVMLLIWSLLFIIYSLTLSVMFFSYSLIVLIIVLILLVNFQPYKKAAVCYPSTDTTFFILLSLVFSVLLGLDTSSTESHLLGLILIIVSLMSALVPLLYIAFFILSWLIKAKRVNDG